MLIPFGCCAPEREHFLERIFTKLEGEKAKRILLRDRFRKITCNFVMTRNAPDYRGCTFGVRAFRVRDKKIDKNLRNQPECGQKEHGICSYCSVRSIHISHAAGGRKEWESGGLSRFLIQLCIAPHWRALVLTSQWRQKPFLTRAGSSDSHEAHGDGGKNKQLGLDFFTKSALPAWMPFFSSSSHSAPLFPPPLDSLCSSSPSLTLVLLLFFCIVRFNSVTYGVLRGTSACLTCRFGSAWLPVSVFPGTDLVFFFCDGEFILFYLRLPSLSELHQCRTFPRLCRELFFSASVKMLFVDCMKFPLDSLWLKSAIQCTARVIRLWTLTKWDQWAGSINEAHSGAGS